MNDELFTIVGVMPKNFQFPIQAEHVDFWIPTEIDAQSGLMTRRDASVLQVIARLRDGVSASQAQAAISAIARHSAGTTPAAGRPDFKLVLEFQHLTGNIRPVLLILFSAVAFVLAIACVNAANLLIARANVRQKEIAVRVALGAGRGRVMTQLLTEGILLSILGCAVGALLASLAIPFLVRLVPADIPRITYAHLDGRVLLFTICISIGAGILFSLAPALRISRTDLIVSLRDRGGHSGSAGQIRSRQALITAEVALSMVLLTAAGLLINSLVRLNSVDPGFNSDRVLTAKLFLQPTRYSESRQTAFYDELRSQLARAPGVMAASTIFPVPLSGEYLTVNFAVEGEPQTANSQPEAKVSLASSGYFGTMRIPFIRGRDFNPGDNEKSTPVIIVNSSLAVRFFPDGDALGQMIKPEMPGPPGAQRWRQIVGVAGDVKSQSPQADAGLEIYIPAAQFPLNAMALAVRTATEPQSAARMLRQEVARLDNEVPVYDVRTMNQYMPMTVAQPPFSALLFAVFAGLALVLSAVGLYGVVSYSVSKRTHEIGTRMALGASKKAVLKMVVGQGLRLAIIGLLIGMVAALGLTRILTRMLYGIGPTDPLTFCVVAVLMTAMVVLASAVPAWRAANIEPMQALRYECETSCAPLPGARRGSRRPS